MLLPNIFGIPLRVFTPQERHRELVLASLLSFPRVLLGKRRVVLQQPLLKRSHGRCFVFLLLRVILASDLAVDGPVVIVSPNPPFFLLSQADERALG